MVPHASDTYLKTEEGYYIAWSLEVPSPYGDWSLVEVIIRRNRPKSLIEIKYLRALTSEEVMGIKQKPWLLWGMKVPFRPWSLVMYRPASFQGHVGSYEYNEQDSNRAIGV